MLRKRNILLITMKSVNFLIVLTLQTCVFPKKLLHFETMKGLSASGSVPAGSYIDSRMHSTRRRGIACKMRESRSSAEAYLQLAAVSQSKADTIEHSNSSSLNRRVRKTKARTITILRSRNCATIGAIKKCSAIRRN